MPKYTVMKANNAGNFSVEADDYTDAGHEGEWIEFLAKKDGTRHKVHRIRSREVSQIIEESE
jgi:hypothetical protein